VVAVVVESLLTMRLLCEPVATSMPESSCAYLELPVIVLPGEESKRIPGRRPPVALGVAKLVLDLTRFLVEPDRKYSP
jgi:hypothetical protein